MLMHEKLSDCVSQSDSPDSASPSADPPALLSHMSSPADSSSDDDDGYYGPSLPPASPPDPPQKQEVIGPVLPSQWTGSSVSEDDDEDAAAIGPLPPGDAAHDPHRNHQPVLRKPQNDVPQREEWMTVIPEKVEKRLGFKSVTSFSKRPIGPPAGKSEQATAGDGKEVKETAAGTEERKRVASLLDSHQDQIKKKKSDAVAGKVERQPFDPEKDLQVRKLDPKQTRSVISNSKLLNTRFSSGPSKFL